MQSDNRILASVALFGELYEQRHDIYDLVAEFLRAAIIADSHWVFNSSDANKLLRKHFDFELPEAVIRSTIRNRLTRSGFAQATGTNFTVLEPSKESNIPFESEFGRLKGQYDAIFEALYEYSAQFEEIDTNDRSAIRENFSKTILGEIVPEVYSRMNSAFIVAKKDQEGFQDALNQIREGLVIYAGIHSQPNLNELGTWNTDLVIYLDTELIFSMAGYNGMVFETLFNDFHALVKEINTKHQGRGGRTRITLRFFEEVADEISAYFKACESVLKGYGYKPLKPAMQAILNGCGSVDEIMIKKAKLFRKLETEGIIKDESPGISETLRFNVESSELLSEITKEYGYRNTFDENSVATILKQFTRVNTIRRGINEVPFEQCTAIILTGDRLTRALANHPKVKFGERDFPFAIDLDSVTNRFWFKLNKGFRNRSDLPKSFDVVTRSQIVLASYGGFAISERYNRLLEKIEIGEIDNEVAIHVLHGLRSSPYRPEDIEPATVPALLELLDDTNLDNYAHELEALKRRASEADTHELALVKTLAHNRRLEIEKRKIQNGGKRKLVKIAGRVASVAIISTPIIAASIVFTILFFLKEDTDTKLTFIGTAATFILPFGTFVLFRKWLRTKVRTILLNQYRRSLDQHGAKNSILRIHG